MHQHAVNLLVYSVCRYVCVCVYVCMLVIGYLMVTWLVARQAWSNSLTLFTYMHAYTHTQTYTHLQTHPQTPKAVAAISLFRLNDERFWPLKVLEVDVLCPAYHYQVCDVYCVMLLLLCCSLWWLLALLYHDGCGSWWNTYTCSWLQGLSC